MIVFCRRLIHLIWIAWLPQVAMAEEVPVVAPVSAPIASQVDASPVAGDQAMPLAGAAVSAPSAAPPPAPVEDCRALTFKAMAADVKAFSARSKKTELVEQAQFFKEAVVLWSRAVDQCDGVARDQAQRNLADSRKVLDGIAEQMGSGPECTSAHKDAASLQEMAKQALSERRWVDSAMLFNKAENMWMLAGELCSGSQRDVAERHRLESATDGHNAEHCAPIFEKAREQMQKMRTPMAPLTREEKQEISMVAETLWRDALAQCRGNTVQEIARNNAQSLARERGTPWVPRVVVAPASAVSATLPMATAPAAVASATVAVSAVPTKSIVQPVVAQSTSHQAVPTVPTNVVSVRPAVSVAGSMVVTPVSLPVKPEVEREGSELAAASAPVPVASAVVPSNPLPALATPVATLNNSPGQVQPIRREEVRLMTVFDADKDARRLNVYTGLAKVRWASGDMYEGEVDKGIRQGKGKFSWSSGQVYEGDWSNDLATGQGVIRFVNGNRYEGAVVNGIPNGQGKTRFSSGDIYTGNFVAGERDGLGEYLWLNGDKYVGQWKSGRKHGRGQFILMNGERWEVTHEYDSETSRDLLLQTAPAASAGGGVH